MKFTPFLSPDNSFYSPIKLNWLTVFDCSFSFMIGFQLAECFESNIVIQLVIYWLFCFVLLLVHMYKPEPDQEDE